MELILFTQCVIMMMDQGRPRQRPRETSKEQEQYKRRIMTKQVYGMRFCHECKTLLKPAHGNGHILDFWCERCMAPRYFDYSEKEGEDCLLYSKQLQVGSKKYVPEQAYIFDPTMPSVEVECPSCGYNRAVYQLTPDQGETKMLAVMMCTSSFGQLAKCGHSWVLPESSRLLKNRVQTEDERFLEEFDG